jgi:hypothetical protein
MGLWAIRSFPWLCSGFEERAENSLNRSPDRVKRREFITILGAVAVVSSLTHRRCCAAGRPADTRCARVQGNRAVL